MDRLHRAVGTSHRSHEVVDDPLLAHGCLAVHRNEHDVIGDEGEKLVQVLAVAGHPEAIERVLCAFLQGSQLVVRCLDLVLNDQARRGRSSGQRNAGRSDDQHEPWNTGGSIATFCHGEVLLLLELVQRAR
jgi:hypothetical protein